MILLPNHLQGLPVVGGSFVPHKDVPDDWQMELAKVAPQTQSLSWLKLVWVAGTPEDTVQRWVIFQMTARDKIPELMLDMLQGPPPHPVTNPIDLMREQWDLFRETRCYAQPFWIIQGDKGGHKRHFNRVEQLQCKMHRRPQYPPVAGSLPYAPFDRRVVEKLAPLDRIRFAERGVAFCEGEEWKAAELTFAEQQAALSQFNGELWDWLESQADAAYDSVVTLQNEDSILSDIPTSPETPFLDADEIRRDFTQMGEV